MSDLDYPPTLYGSLILPIKSALGIKEAFKTNKDCILSVGDVKIELKLFDLSLTRSDNGHIDDFETKIRFVQPRPMKDNDVQP